jgi:diguanylate cyclase (GGDEF)-like protein/PAS domain S-box-containing protein
MCKKNTLLYRLYILLGVIILSAPLALHSAEEYPGDSASVHNETGEKPDKYYEVFTEKERKWLENNPRIRFAPAPNYPPVEFFDEDGTYRGITADFIQLIREEFGISFEIVQLKNWSQVVTRSKKREVDMWGAAAKTPEREVYMEFTEPYITLPAVIIVRKEMSGNLTMEDLRDKKVVLIENYASQDYVRENYPYLNTLSVPDIKTGLQMVSFGVADAIIATNASAIYYIEKYGLSNLRVCGESGYEWHLCFAVRSDWPLLHSIIQKALDDIPEEKEKEIFRHWISLEAPGFRLTKVQIAIIIVSIIILLTIAVFIWNINLRRAIDRQTERLNHTLLEQALILENVPVGIAHVVGKEIQWVNASLAEELGYHEDELVGQDVSLFFSHTEDGEKALERYENALESGGYYKEQFKIIHTKRKELWREISAMAMASEKRNERLFIIENITSRKELEHHLTDLAITDPLTSVYNRRHFTECAEREIKRSRRSGHPFSILMIDLDHFKQINDTYGHAAGDDILVSFTDIIQPVLRKHDILGRIGGEEFALWLPDTDEKGALRLAERIRKKVEAMKVPFNSEYIGVTVSIGILSMDTLDETLTLDDLLQTADRALYRAKRNGRNRIETRDTGL